MKQKILPVTYPMITCHPSTAGLMSILNNYSCTKSWIYSNYIQFVGGIREVNIYGGGSFDVAILPSYHAEKNCPWILHSQLTRRTVKQLSDSIINFIIMAIDTENYVYLVVDEFYISKTNAGKGHFHMPHDIFIYGYSIDKQVLYVGDFTFNESSKFVYETIAFEEFERGYNDITLETDFFYYEKGGVALLNFYGNAKYTFDKEFVKEQFSELYQSTDYSEKFRCAENPFDRRAYGIEVYDLLISFLKQPSEIYKGLTKSLAILNDHKVLMIERIQYMDDNGYLANSEEVLLAYKQILNKFTILVSLSIKYSITKNRTIIDRMLGILDDVRKMEKILIQEILQS